MRSAHPAWNSLRTILFFTIALVPLAACASQASDAPAAAPHFWNNPAHRTIVIAGAADHLEKKGDILLTNLIEGELPAGMHEATVLTDSNCAPDENGISHCLNQLQIGSTRVLVQHHHDMSKVPCLSPGEIVNVVDVQSFKQL